MLVKDVKKRRTSKMADIELKHSAKGSTWQKNGAAYISRVRKNGKWVYTYNKQGKTPSNKSINNEMYKADYSGVRHDAKFTKSSPKKFIGKTVKQVSDEHYSNAESLKRKQVSAQRNVQKDPRYKVEAKAAYLKNKASRAVRKNVAKGKKKVSEILSRLRESASSASKIANRKYKAAQKAASYATTQAKNTAKTTARKAKKKIQNAVSVKETAYITDVSTGKRRPAPTDLFDNAKTTSRKKKMSGGGTFTTSDNKKIKVNPTKKMSGGGTFTTSDNKKIKVNRKKKRKS